MKMSTALGTIGGAVAGMLASLLVNAISSKEVGKAADRSESSRVKQPTDESPSLVSHNSVLASVLPERLPKAAEPVPSSSAAAISGPQPELTLQEQRTRELALHHQALEEHAREPTDRHWASMMARSLTEALEAAGTSNHFQLV